MSRPRSQRNCRDIPWCPQTLIGRLAVIIDFRIQGHGETLLMDALHRILQHSGKGASAGVIVDARDAEAVSFYKTYGFLVLPDVERRSFLLCCFSLKWREDALRW